MTPAKPQVKSQHESWTNRFLVAVLLMLTAEIFQDYWNGMKTDAVNDYRLTVAEKVLDKFEDLPERVAAVEKHVDRLGDRVLGLETANLRGND